MAKKIWTLKKRLAVALVLLFLTAGGGFLFYVNDYYPAHDVALVVRQEGEDIEEHEHLTVLATPEPTDTALIFYPGAKVDANAYLPLLDQIREGGITCMLVEMPFRLAVFDSDAASTVMAQHPNIRHWYIGGHSLGGAMAAKFASDNKDAVDGLILLGAYRYGDYPAEDTLIVYGSLNETIAEHVTPDECVVVIKGGNHAQFGNYGPQKGDATATISAAEQQRQTVAAIETFLEGNH